MSGPAYYTGQMNIALNEDWIVAFLYAAYNLDGSTTPIDLTGSILTLEIRSQDIDPQVFVAVSSENNDGIFITNAPGGAFTILIGREQAFQQLSPGSYVSDLVRLMPNGYVERILDCTVNVAEGVTR